MMYYDYPQGKSFQQCFQSLSKVCQTAFGTILDCYLQFTSGTRNFSSAERRLKTVTVVANLLQLLPNKSLAVVKCLIKEEPRINESEIKDSFNLLLGSFESDSSSSPG